MVVTASGLRAEFNSVISSYGTIIRFKYYTVSGTTGSYDDARTLTQSGTDFWTSGMFQRVGKTSSDAILLEQGRVLLDDSKLYVAGTVNTSGTWQVGVGSPTTKEYSNIAPGQDFWDLQGNTVYKIAYVRYLPNGSIYSL